MWHESRIGLRLVSQQSRKDRAGWDVPRLPGSPSRATGKLDVLDVDHSRFLTCQENGATLQERTSSVFSAE